MGSGCRVLFSARSLRVSLPKDNGAGLFGSKRLMQLSLVC